MVRALLQFYKTHIFWFAVLHSLEFLIFLLASGLRYLVFFCIYYLRIWMYWCI